MAVQTASTIGIATDSAGIYRKNNAASVDNVFVFTDGTDKWEIIDKKGSYTAKLGGVLPGSDMTSRLNTIFADAAVYEVVFDNGDITISGTLDCQNKKVRFENNGKIIGSGTVLEAVIISDQRSQIFSATTKLKDCTAPDYTISGKWFGAVGDNVTDDTAALQQWLDCAVGFDISYRNYFRKAYLPGGLYHITNGLVCWRDYNADGFPDFFGIDIYGDFVAYGSPVDTQIGTLIRASHVDNFALAIQFGKGCRVMGIQLIGDNNNYGMSIAQIYGGVRTDFITGSCRNNGYSPYSGIVIDPFHTIQGANKYPRMTRYYDVLVDTNTTGSTDIIIENCYVSQFVCGVIFSPNGESQNAECCVIRDCWIQACVSAIVNAQSQTRENEVQNLKVWGNVHTIFDCRNYGQGNGVAPNVVGVNIAGFNYQMFYLLGGWTNASFVNVYAELLFRLGDWGSGNNGLPVTFYGCYFDISTNVWFTCANYITTNAVFIGCIIRQYNNRQGFITCGGGMVTFINCMLSAPVVYIGNLEWATLTPSATGDIRYINCNAYCLPVVSDSAHITSELFESGVYQGAQYQRLPYGVRTAKVIPQVFGQEFNPSPAREDHPFNIEYGLSGEAMASVLRYVNNESGLTVTFNSGNGSAQFTTTDADKWRVGDICISSISGSIDGNTYSWSVLGVVDDITGTTITLKSVTDINPTGATKTGVSIWAMEYAFFCEPIIGETTSGTNTILNCKYPKRVEQIRMGSRIMHPHFPYGTRIVSIVGTTITVSKNATATDTHAVIEFTRLDGKGAATAEPTTISVAGYSTYLSKQALFIKGAFIRNRGTDTTKAGWLCTRTGYLGSGKEPTFVAVSAGSGGAAKITITPSADTSQAFVSGDYVTRVVVIPSSALTGFKIGTTNGGEEILSAQPLDAQTNPIAVDYYFTGAGSLYFGGITVSTTIIIYYE